jgi:hypothetical protein
MDWWSGSSDSEALSSNLSATKKTPKNKKKTQKSKWRRSKNWTVMLNTSYGGNKKTESVLPKGLLEVPGLQRQGAASTHGV